MDFLTRSFRIATVFDVTIRVHVLYLIWMGYRLYTAQGAWGAELMFLGMLFGIILIHEYGHCFGARSVGGDARDILMWPLGGLAFAHAPMAAWPQFVTVACGPLVNVIFCVVSAGVLIGSTGALDVVSFNVFARPNLNSFTAIWQFYVWQFFWVNLMLLYFNLLPIYPLDGGQLFMTLIWPFVGLQRATQIACQIGLVGAVVLAGLGAYRGIFLLVGIAIFGGMTCYQRLQALKYGMVVEDPVYGFGKSAMYKPGGGFWARLFKRVSQSRKSARPVRTANPNPGGWEAKQTERERTEAELDRILKKVSDQGIHSLSYVERQTLERATRERQKRERELERQHRR